ncbi:hypothetical protein ANOM_003196 [Aspergillus nomiae NRRL 13137]|uniref:Fe2OG dioxygenase domain-containing protein n=1 Tax=Aspergillus nomiae NRRL (strain ATCC 15546 / NRRL 13137 / CBS 260.88 / M93) TaxID=1509407 RepID=A0A0L1JCU9_ASPN3|nr:uncharacterized protein ANOM_003196 [Aspergillus nomiae NRRL 13137]KNG89604.1 hypothetical protein ANOM_003196 [Aspergillus nomiae NRRL 13137]
MAVAISPPKVVGPLQMKRTKATKQLPQSLADTARRIERTTFDPTKHLNYANPEKVYSMKDIGLEGRGISATALTTPFSLFTEEAINQMRAELFDPEILENYHVCSDFASNMLKGFGPQRAPFIHAVWNSPEVLEIMSSLLGIGVVPVFEYEVGHTNVSVNSGSNASSDAQTDSTPDEDDSAFSWHFDSVPFVCVTMLSDCTGMVGGETAVRLDTDEVMKVRGPTKGCSVVMQGRYIEHQALKAHGGAERITMVTSFRPKSALVKDETVLVGFRPISHLPEIYKQYSEYRLENLEERIRHQLRKVRERERAQLIFDTAAMKNFLREQRDYIDTTLDELVEDSDS